MSAPAAPPRRPWAAAAVVAALTSLGFVVVYGATNALAASRGTLPTWAFGWESAIPLVPWMVIPYMSIDLFFVGAPFLCGDRHELATFTKRVVTAILVAGLVFACVPLTLAFTRTPVDGPFGPVFAFLYGFDRPHNLFPSLHVTLAFILRWTYHRHTRGPWRRLMHGWFVLVTASTLLTHQHQVVDVLGGAALAVCVFYLFPTGLITRRDVAVTRAPSRPLAGAFGTGAALAATAAWIAASRNGGAALLLGWTALALGLVAAGYAGLGPRVFRKYAGYLSIPARLILAPYLLPLWLSRRWYWRSDPQRFVHVADGVYVGRLPDAALAAELEAAGVRTVIDLCAEHAELPQLRRLDYHCEPMMDLAQPDPAALGRVVGLIERGRAAGGVYVHCALGYGRSRKAVAWWLTATGRATGYAAATAQVAAVRGFTPTRADVPPRRLREWPT